MFREFNNYRVSMSNGVNNTSGFRSVRGNIVDKDVIAERCRTSNKYEKAVEKSAIKEESSLIAGGGVSITNSMLTYAPEAVNAEGVCASEVGEKVSQLFEGGMVLGEMEAALQEELNESEVLEFESKKKEEEITKSDDDDDGVDDDELKSSGHSLLHTLNNGDSNIKLKNAFTEIATKNAAENLKETIGKLGLEIGNMGSYLNAAIDRLTSPALIATDRQNGVLDNLISGSGDTVSAIKSLLETTQSKTELLRFAFGFLNEELAEENDPAYTALRTTINSLAAETEKFAAAVSNIIIQLENEKKSSTSNGSDVSSVDNQTSSSSVSSKGGVKGSDRNTAFVQGSPAEYHTISLIFVLLPISESMSKQGLVLANQLDELTDSTNTVIAGQADADEATKDKYDKALKDELKQIEKQKHKRGIFGISFGALDIVSAVVSVCSAVKDAATLNFASVGADFTASGYLVSDGVIKIGSGTILVTGADKAVYEAIKKIADTLGISCMDVEDYEDLLAGLSMYGVGEVCAQIMGGDPATWQTCIQTVVSAMMALSGLGGAFDAMFAAESAAQQALITVVVVVELTTIACSIATMVQAIKNGSQNKYLQFASMSPIMAFVLFLADMATKAQQKSDNSFVSDVLPMIEVLVLAGVSPALALVFFLSEVEARAKYNPNGQGPMTDLFKMLGGNVDIVKSINEHISPKIREQIVNVLETVVCMAAGMGTSYASSKMMASTTERYLAKSPDNKTQSTKILENLKNNMSEKSWSRLQSLSSMGSKGMTFATGLMKGMGVSMMLTALQSTLTTIATYKNSYEQKKAAIDAEQQVQLQQLYNQWVSNTINQLQQTSQTISSTLKSNMDAQNGFFKTIQNMIRDFSARNPRL